MKSRVSIAHDVRQIALPGKRPSVGSGNKIGIFRLPDENKAHTCSKQEQVERVEEDAQSL
jgi:hypothetical protein